MILPVSAFSKNCQRPASGCFTEGKEKPQRGRCGSNRDGEIRGILSHGCSYKYLSVTAPSEAELTSLAYFASTPRVSRVGRGLYAAMRAAYSASGISRLIVFLTASTSMRS